MGKCDVFFRETSLKSIKNLLKIIFSRNIKITGHANTKNIFQNTLRTLTLSGAQYAIPKIKMLRNLSCLKARFRLLGNKLSTAQQPEPRFKRA